MKKKLVSFIAFALALVMAMTSLPVGAVLAASAEDRRMIVSDCDDKTVSTKTQSHYQNFSNNYTLTGNGANDIVAVALAQEGKSGSQLGYTEEWCADFVGDCAILAGQSTAVPLYGGVQGLKNRIINAGGVITTSNPAVGDICFIDWNPSGTASAYDHVEIVYSVSGGKVHTIGGNSGGNSTLYTRVVKKHSPLSNNVIVCIVRPAYSTNGSSNPSIPNSPNPSNDSTDPTQYTIPTSYLNQGASGTGVKWLQACLCQTGFTCAVDGKFGSGTVTQLKAFQRAYGLTVDGGFGPQVRNKMLELLTCPKPTASWTYVSTGTKINMSYTPGQFTNNGDLTLYNPNWDGINDTNHSTVFINATSASEIVTAAGNYKVKVTKSCRYPSEVFTISVPVTTFTVTFKDWNGTVLKTQTVYQTGSATAPANPTRTGYTFTGWDRAFNNVTSNLTVNAVYSINTYTVTFKNWDGTTLKTQTVNYGGAATAPANPTRTGYTFTGWDRAFNNVTSNLTVNAQFAINTYTVTFKDWDGTTLKTQTVNYGGAATAPANPTRTGYTFTGWDKVFNNVTSNLTVNAVYEADVFTIDVNTRVDGAFYTTDQGAGNFDMYINGVCVGDDIADYCTMHTYGTPFEINDIKPMPGFAYEGIESGERTGTASTDGSDHVTLVFTTINVNSITEQPEAHVFNGHTYYLFTTPATWYLANAFCEASGGHLVTINSNQENEYIQTLLGDGDVVWIGATDQDSEENWSWVTEEEMLYQNWSTNEPNNFPSTHNSEEDYAVFWANSGLWNDLDGHNKYMFVLEIDRVNEEHTVTFKDWDGTELNSQTVQHGEAAIAPANPTRPGYTFIGWDRAFDNVTADLMVTALYQQNTPEPTATPTVAPTAAPSTPSPDEPQIVVSSKTVTAGSTVTVDVSFLNNPGIVSMALTVDFDERLELVSVTDSGLIPGQVHSPTMGNPYVLCWVNDTATENFTANGVIATLTFEIPEDMPVGEYPITVSYDLDNYDIYNCDVELVEFAVVNGRVNVIDVLIGDVNTDTKVNALDRLYLTRFLAKWADYPEAVINMIAADVNVDTKVNALDRLILTRHLAKWAGYETLPYSAKSAPEAKEIETKGSEPAIVVDSVAAEPGETVTVCVSLENNPGIVSMMLTVDFDQALELIGRTDTGLLPGQVHSPTLGNPYTLCWVNDTATTNYTVNGSLVELTFKLSENAEPGEYPITISYDLDNYDIYNCDVELVEFAVVNGGVTYEPDEPTTHTVTFIDPITGEVIAEVEVEHGEAAEAPEAPAHEWYSFTGWDVDFSAVTEDMTVTAQYTELGDINGDGTVDMRDALQLMRWLIGSDELACDEAEADFNSDGKTDLMDALLLMRHILGTI